MIKRELDFGVDNFNEQKILSDKESIAQILKNILFMRPGNMPSMPHIGINIQSKLYSFDDSLDVEELKTEISSQCSAIIPYLDFDGMNLYVANHKGSTQPILMIIIPVLLENQKEELIVGIEKSTQGEIMFNYQFDVIS